MPPSRQRLLAVLLLSCLAAAAPVSAEGSPRIVNGLSTTDFPTTGALLFGSTEGQATQICTGTMIGCETFLTAAHCVCEGPGAACDPAESQHFVYLQHSGIHAVSLITPHPSYDAAGAPSNDVAVVRLSAPITGISPTPLATTAPAFGTSGTVAGFGLDAEQSAPDASGIKRQGKITTEDCTPIKDTNNTQHICWTFPPPFGPPGEDSNTCQGDSGGPLFVEQTGQTVVAGITSFGGGQTSCSDGISADANVATFASFIQMHGGTDLQNMACGTIPQVGAAGATVHGFEGTLSTATPEGNHSFDVPAGTSELRVTLNGVSPADFDLYARAGTAPTTLMFDCASTAFSQFETCSFMSPTAGTWHVMARRITGDGAYQITGTVFGAPSVCGDGMLGTGEQCDDGNVVGGDGCNATCMHENCGDGMLGMHEQCDDGNMVAGDGCSPQCTTEVPAGCGDGTLGTGEQCDDGNLVAGDGCSAQCTIEDGSCPAVPAASCEESVTGKTRLSMKWGKNKLSWQWKDILSLSDFGDPVLGDTSYRLCVYDEVAGVPGLALQALMPAQTQWTNKRTGFKFKNKTTLYDGIRQVVLKEGRKASIKVTGQNMSFPTQLVQDGNVIVQLANTVGGCWQGCYDAPAQKNTGIKFTDKEAFVCNTGAAAATP